MGEAVDSRLALPQNLNPESRREGYRPGLPIRVGSGGGAVGEVVDSRLDILFTFRLLFMFHCWAGWLMDEFVR